MKITIKKKMKQRAQEASSSSSSSSAVAQTVVSIDDLLVEILLRLPMKSLIRFKSVSKHWLSLITDPQFALRRNHKPNPAVGLFLPSTNGYDYIPFDVRNPTTPPFKNLTSTKDLSSMRIVNSCNGLLLCANSSSSRFKSPNYHVYNPITKQLTTLPMLRPVTGRPGEFRGATLAFDPAKSPQYKVVCVRDFGIYPPKYQVQIYSSEEGPWRASGEPFTEELNTNFTRGVYWNGAVHWISGPREMTSLYFNVDEERLGLMRMPPSNIPEDWYSVENTDYFDESCDHLHMIDIWGQQLQFNVYELKRDYSEWYVKYHVDLSEVATAFPGILRIPATENIGYSFLIFALIRGEKEEDAFLVLRIPGKAIRYNLVTKTFEKLCDFEGGEEEDYYRFFNTIPYQYIETLCCV